MVTLSGLTVFDENNKLGDIEIEFIGLRKGEKLYEELVIGEKFEYSSNPLIFKCKEYFPDSEKIDEIVLLSADLVDNENKDGLIQILNNNVEGFKKN